VVRADEIKQRRAGKSPGVIANGIDRKRYTASFDFLVVDFTIGLASQSEPQQAQSLFRRRERQARLERRLRGGNEEQPLQLQFLARRLRHEQMAAMDRIERASQ